MVFHFGVLVNRIIHLTVSMAARIFPMSAANRCLAAILKPMTNRTSFRGKGWTVVWAGFRRYAKRSTTGFRSRLGTSAKPCRGACIASYGDPGLGRSFFLAESEPRCPSLVPDIPPRVADCLLRHAE